LHSSTFADASVRVGRDGRVISASFNAPRDSVEVLDASVDFFTASNGEFVALESQNEAVSNSVCTPSLVDDLLAIEGCAQMSYHLPADMERGSRTGLDAFMFAGPMKFRVAATKSDTFERYSLLYSWDRDEEASTEEEPVTSLKTSFDAIGSSRPHRTSFELSYGDGGKFLNSEVRFPCGQVIGRLR